MSILQFSSPCIHANFIHPSSSDPFKQVRLKLKSEIEDKSRKKSRKKEEKEQARVSRDRRDDEEVFDIKYLHRFPCRFEYHCDKPSVIAPASTRNTMIPNNAAPTYGSSVNRCTGSITSTVVYLENIHQTKKYIAQ